MLHNQARALTWAVWGQLRADGRDLVSSKPLSPSVLKICVSHSFNLGLYITNTPASGPSGLATAPKPTKIGLARLVTDYTTFAYLTDVYVLPEEQRALGRWLIQCVNVVVEGMADLRKCLMFCTEGPAEAFYERELGVNRRENVVGGSVLMQRSGSGAVVK